VRAWPRRDRVEATRCAVQVRAVAGLAQDQKPGRAGRATDRKYRMVILLTKINAAMSDCRQVGEFEEERLYGRPPETNNGTPWLAARA